MVTTSPLTPQDKAINHSPIPQAWEMYEHDGKYQGHLIDWKPWYQSIRDYECVFNFEGKNAHYYIVSSDRSITRAEALSFAKALHEGKVHRIHIDATLCGHNGKQK